MAIKGMAHIGMVVEDLPAATEFFVQLGLELLGEGQVEGDWVGRIIGLPQRPRRNSDAADPGWSRRDRAVEIPIAGELRQQGIIVELAEKIG
jgi:catechol 2,3-dioxygenase-like lactoylglutathione lyase family enzyme